MSADSAAEFTYPGRNNPQWTTRCASKPHDWTDRSVAVTTASGQQDAPTYATQPGGDAIPCASVECAASADQAGGIGALASGSNGAGSASVVPSIVPVVANATSTPVGRAAISAASAASVLGASVPRCDADSPAASIAANAATVTPTSTSVVVVTASCVRAAGRTLTSQGRQRVGVRQRLGRHQPDRCRCVLVHRRQWSCRCPACRRGPRRGARLSHPDRVRPRGHSSPFYAHIVASYLSHLVLHCSLFARSRSASS